MLDGLHLRLRQFTKILIPQQFTAAVGTRNLQNLAQFLLAHGWVFGHRYRWSGLPAAYLATLARVPVFRDPTEYTVVSARLAIAHPPGYALLPDPMDWAAAGAVESGGSFTVAPPAWMRWRPPMCRPASMRRRWRR